MKDKITVIILTAAVSLGACVAAPKENSYAASDYPRAAPVFPGKKLSHADVRKVQRSLYREGFYKGKIDGLWGVRTSQAILDYQAARHPGQTAVTVDTLQEFGVRVDKESYLSL